MASKKKPKAKKKPSKSNVAYKAIKACAALSIESKRAIHEHLYVTFFVNK